MKQLLLSLAAYFLCPSGTFSQTGGNSHIEMYLKTVSSQRTVEFTEFSPTEMRQMAQHKIYHVERIRTAGKKSYTTQYTLNEAGRPLKMLRENHTVTYTYLDDSLMRTIESKGKKTALTRFEYEGNKLCSRESLSDGRALSRLLVRYDGDGRVVFSLLQEGRNLKNSYTLTNEYVDGKIACQRFDRNGKVFREWDYSCQPEGTVRAKGVGEICVFREENNDGSFVRHMRMMNEYATLLYKQHYRSDSTLMKIETLREDGTLSQLREYFPDSMIEHNYSRKGEIVKERTLRYDLNRNLIESKEVNKKGQVKILRYDYTEDNLLHKRELVMDNKVKSSDLYIYSYR